MYSAGMGGPQVVRAPARPSSLNLRGSLSKASTPGAPATAPAETGLASVRLDFGSADPATPVEGAPLSEVMQVISDRYDLNVQET